MVVAVQQPRQKESDLDQVLKGLRIVGGIFDIKNQLDTAERLKAQQTIAEQKAARDQSAFETQERLRRGEFQSQAEFLSSPLAKTSILNEDVRPLGQSAADATLAMGHGPIRPEQAELEGGIKPEGDITIGGKSYGLQGIEQLKQAQKREFEDLGVVTRQQLTNLFRSFKRAPEGKEEFSITTPDGEMIGLVKRDSIDQLTAAQLLSDTRAQQRLAEQQRQFDAKQRQRELDRLSKERLSEAKKKAAAEAKIKKDAEKEKANIQKELKRATLDVQSWKIQEAWTALDALNKKINIKGKGDIPGVGGDIVGVAGSIPFFGRPFAKALSTKEEAEIRTLIGNFRDAMLNMRSGAALSTQEADRITDSLGMGVGHKDVTVRAGLDYAVNTLLGKVNLLEAGLSDEALQQWRMKERVPHSGQKLFRGRAGYYSGGKKSASEAYLNRQR